LDVANQKWKTSLPDEDYCFDQLLIPEDLQGKCSPVENDVVIICLNKQGNDGDTNVCKKNEILRQGFSECFFFII